MNASRVTVQVLGVGLALLIGSQAVPAATPTPPASDTQPAPAATTPPQPTIDGEAQPESSPTPTPPLAEEEGSGAADDPGAEDAVAEAEPPSYMKLTGRIWRAKSGFAFARTPVGTLTLFSERGLRTVRAGQTVTVWTRGSNLVVDIFRRGSDEPEHRFITGTPAFTTPDRSRLTLWTPDGGADLDAAPLKGRLGTAGEGDPITVQLGPSGEIVDTPGINIDIQISDGTKKRSGTHMKLAGTVSRVKAGFAFIDTPIGALTLSKKTGLRDAKAGQEVTVWLNDQHLVIDVRQSGEPAPDRRFITSPVVYASKDKTEIKLWTPEGERILPLPTGKKTRKRFREGTPVTIQLNASGEVIEVRRAG